jgi:hypothetical protein
MFHHFGRTEHTRAVNAQAVALEDAFVCPWGRAGCGEFQWAEWRCAGETSAEGGRKSRPPLRRSPRAGTSGSTTVPRRMRSGARWATAGWQMLSIGFRGTLQWLGLRPPGECCCAYRRTPVRHARFPSLRTSDLCDGVITHLKRRPRVGVAGSRSSLERARVAIWSRVPGGPAGIRWEM